MEINERDSITVQVGSTLLSGTVIEVENGYIVYLDKHDVERWAYDYQVKSVNGKSV